MTSKTTGTHGELSGIAGGDSDLVRIGVRSIPFQDVTARQDGKLAEQRGSDRAPEDRARHRDLWTKAKIAADLLWKAARDHTGYNFQHAAELLAVLERMWDARATRDDNWIGIVEQARSALESLAETDIELVTEGQSWKLLQIVADYLSPATKSIEDLLKATELVEEMGLPPYPGLGALADA